MAEPRTISQQIEHNWEQVRNSAETREAFRRLGKETFAEDAPKARECLTTYLNFEAYKNSLQVFKSRQSRLSPETETWFAERFSQSVAAYRSFVTSSEKISKAFTSSGLEQVLSHHAKHLCWQLPHSKHYPQLASMLKTMGVTDAEVLHYTTVLKDHDWDLLRLQGSDGTFAGTVKLASEQLPSLEKMLTAVQQHGLPVLEGASGSAAPAIIGIIVIVGAGIVCVASGICEFIG